MNGVPLLETRREPIPVPKALTVFAGQARGSAPA